MPIGYLNECVAAAQREGLDDVALQGSRVLLNISNTAPHNTRITGVHLNVAKGMFDIAIKFYVTPNKEALGNRVINDLLEVVFNVTLQGHFESDNLLEDVLNKIETMLITLSNADKLTTTYFISQALSPVYDLTSQYSLGYYVANASELIKKDEKKDWVNPYLEFIKLNERITRHLYTVGEKVDFGSNFLHWHIIHAVKHIAKVYIEEFEKPKTDHPDHLKTLENSFSRYLSFFWLSFDKKKSVHYQFATEATEVSAFIALSFYRLGYPEIVRFCIDNIFVIADVYRQSPDSRMSIFNNIDIMMPAWKVRMIAEAKGDDKLVSKIDEKIKELSNNFDAKENFDDSLKHRVRQLDEELSEELHFSQLDNSIGVLKNLLESHTQSSNVPES